MTGTWSAVLLMLVLAVVIAIGAIISLRHECSIHRADAAKWRSYALKEHHSGDSSQEP